MTKTKMEYTDKIGLTRERSIERVRITDSGVASTFARSIMENISLYESSVIILTNAANDTIGWSLIGQGGLTGTIVDVRMIAKIAIDTLATGVFLVHNHPSGSHKPSRYDNEITKQVNEGLKLFDIRLIDHIILAEDYYYSYADQGNL